MKDDPGRAGATLKSPTQLHQQVVMLVASSIEVPDVEDVDRVRVVALEHGFFCVTAKYGFMETPNVPEIIALCVEQGLQTRAQETSYYRAGSPHSDGTGEDGALAQEAVRLPVAERPVGNPVLRPPTESCRGVGIADRVLTD